jgi:nucleotide-binding universal stress UspA family protein/CheY-like chemotaxis protein
MEVIMKILVGYNGGETGRQVLSLARGFAKTNNAFIYIVTSMKGGTAEKQSHILQVKQDLDFARELMTKSGLKCDAKQIIRGLTPAEDLVKFAEENDIDHIFLGIKKKSKAQKVIFGSTSKEVILNASCPVTINKFDLDNIKVEDLLDNRRILVVDDEPDILETVEELLNMCSIDTVSSFDEAKNNLENNQYDMAILDIMGVNGYDILELTRKKNIPSLMLTAHALTPENLKESINKGADSYVPKDELVNLVIYVVDAIKARIASRQGYGAWFKTLKPSFDKSFGKGWREKDRIFWNSFDEKYGKYLPRS